MTHKHAYTRAEFRAQLDMLSHRHIKSQHECLLRALHIAATHKWIRPHTFSKKDSGTFLGWTGFDVIPARSKEFRALIESMFPAPLLENTLNNAFRRAGLVPDKWKDAWKGKCSFGYKS